MAGSVGAGAARRALIGALGVLGGAFNPPHIGHLVLASEAASQLGLGRVLLVPVAEAPHKRIEQDPGPETRLEMSALAAGDDELLEASDLEVARQGPSYSFRTLELLSEQRPDEELFFLMGADVAAYLESWREPERVLDPGQLEHALEPERVLELARVGVAARPGTVLDEAEAALERLGAADRAEVIRMPEIGVSSTRVRRRVVEGRPIRYLVPDAVAAFITERDLYREAVRA